MKLACVVPAYNEERMLGNTLKALSDQSDPIKDIVVVDNGSTDATREVIEDYSRQRTPGTNIHYIIEPSKGTGVACNNGFNYAIDVLGAEVVSRTDADTIPATDWNQSIKRYLINNPTKQLVTGVSLPIKDHDHRIQDDAIIKMANSGFRIGMMLVARSLYPLKCAVGHNMAVRAEIFKHVGGFPDTAIEQADEDIELSRKIYDEFGLSALGLNKDMQVKSSMRRYRAMGYLGMTKCYINPNNPSREEQRLALANGNYDIR